MSSKISIAFEAQTGNLRKGVAEVKAEIRKIGEEAKKQEAANRKLTESFKGYLSAAVSVGAAFQAMRSLVSIGKEYAALAPRAQAAGLSPEYFRKLSDAATVTSGSIEQLQEAASKLTAAVEFSNPAALSTKALEALGFSIENLLSKSPDERFDSVARALASITDESQRTAAAVAVFGEAGAKLVPTFIEINKQADETNTLTTEQIQNLDEAGKAWTRWMLKAKAAVAGVVAEFVSGRFAEKMATIQPGGIAGSGQAAFANSRNPLAGENKKRDPNSYPRGHRGSDKPDFRAMLARQKNAEAEAKAKADRDAKISGFAQEKARIERNMEFAGSDTAGQIRMLDAEAAAMQAEIAKTGDPVRRAELEKNLAENRAAIAALKRKGESSSSSSGGDFAGGAAAPPIPEEPPLSPGELRSDRDLEDFSKDPGNYRPDGSMETIALGRRRYLIRRQEYDRRREDNRLRRMGGGERPSAADAPGSRLERFRNETQAKKDEAMKDPKTLAMEQKSREQAMMDAGNSVSPGATRESDLSAMRAAVERIEKHVAKIEPKIPEGTT